MSLDELYVASVARVVKPNARYEPLTFQLVAERRTFKAHLQDLVTYRTSHWPRKKMWLLLSKLKPPPDFLFIRFLLQDYCLKKSLKLAIL